ncbi:hypothetical protein SAMN05421831_1012 [Allopseudospirillum japonicum]|uniref:UPF0178 protein SAMN05421831_1012 n=1 Tax=Allopseudospirillum japonicum TaxID=64971 RepID=A0A1H6QDV8_9GAMM|nr:YaiI/YqxD family protein [Allopseudospirillum japonicum]SEI37202.1 hypothetical protein SAMN05421831_1012 [Allopseudospirillum japonicum]
MKIWVDADACPSVIRDILYKAAQRLKIHTIFVANQPIRLPQQAYLSQRQVSQGADVADTYIVDHLQAGDLVITQDLPLAADILALQAYALSPRGELFTQDNLGPRLNMRDFMETLRASGIHGGGPSSLSQSDRRNFANQLDKLLHQLTSAST